MKHKVFCGNLFTVYLHLSLQKAKKEALLGGGGGLGGGVLLIMSLV